jgi:UDP-2,3-diacylglucosamine pyrophosphatase LpxH
MLVIISDLHLADGTSGSLLSAGAFRLLRERLQDLAESASQRRCGAYRPVERIDLVLLGDVLEVIRSERWLTEAVRPWSSVNSPDLHRVASAITADILQTNAAALHELRELAQRGVSIPAATRDGRPAHDERQPAPVRIHYMVGNHDWFLHLPGEKYNALRRQVRDHLGLSTPADAPFPHEAWEDNELLQVLRRHKVFARHGDVYDPFNFEGDRNGSSLGDAIVVELLTRFVLQVQRTLGEELPLSVLAALQEIDNVRPLVMAPVWIDGMLERTCPDPALRKQVKVIWDELADEFLELPFVRQRDSWRPFDLVDGLQHALKFSRSLSLGWASRVAQWLNDVQGASTDSYCRHALAEQDFRNRRARHIVYGHTHHAEVLPLDASYAEGYVLHQMYFNSGTWRRVHQQTRFDPREREFIAADTLTFLAFYRDDEREGRPYETWSGTLGISPQSLTTYRVDAQSSRHGDGLPISTPSVPLRPPHFAVPVAARRSHAPAAVVRGGE